MKALNPHLSDGKLGETFGLDRSSIYHLLKEHGLQDLHRVLADTPSREGGPGEPGEPEGDEGKKTLKSSPVPKPEQCSGQLDRILPGQRDL